MFIFEKVLMVKLKIIFGQDHRRIGEGFCHSGSAIQKGHARSSYIRGGGGIAVYEVDDEGVFSLKHISSR